ncbi:3-dehydroquinate dehydratase [Desulfocarbo indianensis]|nr:3-dehydroquinate dehydratase [Desulfocarbo indianensis]
MKVLVLNGPNLNLLGRREPELYGSLSLAQIEERLKTLGRELGLEVDCRQSNHEGELVDAIQEAGEQGVGIILNAGAYTHTSVALRDAVAGSRAVTVEVHLTNPHARESFRQVSLLSGVCAGLVAGFGWESYALALQWFARRREK